MALVTKIDSNVVGLRYAEEASIGVLPVSPAPTWYPLEPNEFDDFGGEITTIARNPINPSRQRKKGVVTDLDASGGFTQDLTQTNMQDLLQGVMFADLRKKSELSVATTTTTSYQPATGGTGYRAGDLLFAKGFASAINNGLKRVPVGSPAPTASNIPVVETLAVAAGQTGIVSRVGHQFASGDAAIDVTDGVVSLEAVSKDLTHFGLIPGEYVFIGGDTVATQFANAANRGFARVRSVTATNIVFDKTEAAFVADAGAGKTIQVFFGRVLKNELDGLIKRRTYQIERTLGAPDDASPSQLQAEYIKGAVPNEMTLDIAQADKITTNLSFIATDSEYRTAAQGVKAGSRPVLVEADAFNTSSDVKRIKLSIYEEGNPAPLPLFAFVTEFSVTVANNVSPNKAVGVLGAFDVTAGTFQVDAEMTAYFSDVVAVQAVRENADVTLDLHLVRANSGITLDLPLVSLGDGRPAVEQDEPITIPLTSAAATGAKIHANLDYTLLWVFWDYLPDLAA